MRRASILIGSLALGALSLGQPAAAQPPGRLGGPGRLNQPIRIATDDASARDTEQRLQELLQQYPPSLGTVLAIDPTLLANAEYLQLYPNLGAFISQHPEVAHNPGFYFGRQLYEWNRRNNNDDHNDPRIAAIRAIENVLGGLAGLTVFITVMFTLAWVIRSVIAHRKWLRMSKTHIDTHAKLMDRLTSNTDLIAYMESPAGRKFLEAAPIPVDGGPRMLNAPFGRILWSMQAGVVVAALGGGLIYASMRIADSSTYSEGSVPLLVVGIAALAIGAGFFVSAIAAWALSSRLGLFAGSTSPDSGTGHAA